MVRRHVLPDRRLSRLFGDHLSLQQPDVEPRHSSLARNPQDATLSFELERDDLRTKGEVGVEERVKNSPDHLRLGPLEADAEALADHGSGAVGPYSEMGARGDLAADAVLGEAYALDLHARAVFFNGRGAVVEPDCQGDIFVAAGLELGEQRLLDLGLADDEHVLVLAMLKAGPPVALARLKGAIGKGRAGCWSSLSVTCPFGRCTHHTKGF